MFDHMLLDSSPSHAPVLTLHHWLISGIAALVGGASACVGLPIILGTADPRAVLVQSGMAGVVFMLCALMACYVHVDARRCGLDPRTWVALTLVANVIGFVIYLVYAASKTGSWRQAALPLAYLYELAMVATLVLAPLIYMEALPKALLRKTLVAPPPPAGPVGRSQAPRRSGRRVTWQDLLAAPTKIPGKVVQIRDEPVLAPPDLVPGVLGGLGVPGGAQNGIPGGIIPLGAAPPPPPLLPHPSTRPTRIKVGGQVEAAKTIFQVKPEYPPLAKMARIQGTVRLEAVISTEGTIRRLKVLAGHPLLVSSAVAAVSRWRYQPTLLNGDPVEVVTEIDVNFTLSD